MKLIITDAGHNFHVLDLTNYQSQEEFHDALEEIAGENWQDVIGFDMTEEEIGEEFWPVNKVEDIQKLDDHFFQYLEVFWANDELWRTEEHVEPFNAWIDNFGLHKKLTIDEMYRSFKDAYIQYEGVVDINSTAFYRDLGRYLADDYGMTEDLPEYLESYFNYEKFAQDKFTDEIFEHNGFLFWVNV